MPSLKDIINKYSRQTRDSRDLPMLLAEASKKNKEFVYSHPEYQLSWLAHLRFKYYLFLYKKGYPLAYIFKHKEFYGLDFYINKNVLVPRPETEHLVDEAKKIIDKKITKLPLLIDVGTGSGCIPIAILKKIKNNLPTIAIDISAKALRVAKKNAWQHKAIIQFIKGDLLQPLLINQKMIKGYDDLIITANLPYLTKKQCESEPSVQREPRQALIANKQGLALYEELLKQIKQLANATIDNHLYIFLEIDPWQSKDIIRLINKCLLKTKITIKPDLAGYDRIIRIDYLNLNS